MTTRIAIIHTTVVTVEPLRRLAAEVVPGAEVVNIVDDSVLPQLAAAGGDLASVEDRLTAYARIAEAGGADVILSACSSVGELVDRLRASVRVPVVRVDEAMAEEAVRRGVRIAVAATLATTLAPTLALLEREAARAATGARIETRLVDAAYRLLAAGDPEGHDRVLAEALSELSATCDVVVLAQASMARVLDRLPAEQRGRFLSSPRLAMERVREELAARALAGTARSAGGGDEASA
jgi:aspartate/glutamate racemase